MSRIVWGSRVPEKPEEGPKQQRLDRWATAPPSGATAAGVDPNASDGQLHHHATTHQPNDTRALVNAVTFANNEPPPKPFSRYRSDGSTTNAPSAAAPSNTNSGGGSSNGRGSGNGAAQYQRPDPPPMFMDNLEAPAVFDNSPYSRAFVAAWRDHRAAVQRAERAEKTSQMGSSGGLKTDSNAVKYEQLTNPPAMLTSSTGVGGTPMPPTSAGGRGTYQQQQQQPFSPPPPPRMPNYSQTTDFDFLLLTPYLPPMMEGATTTLLGGPAAVGRIHRHLQQQQQTSNIMMMGKGEPTSDYYDDDDEEELLMSGEEEVGSGNKGREAVVSDTTSIAPPPTPFIDCSKFPHLANLPTIPFSLLNTNDGLPAPDWVLAMAGGGSAPPIQGNNPSRDYDNFLPNTRAVVGITAPYPLPHSSTPQHQQSHLFPPHWRTIFKDCVFFLNSCDADVLVSHYVLEKLIRFMGGVTVMGISKEVTFIISQHLASGKDQKVKIQPTDVGALTGRGSTATGGGARPGTLDAFFGRKDGGRKTVHGHVDPVGDGQREDAEEELGAMMLPSVLARRPYPNTIRLQSDNALAASTTGTKMNAASASSAAAVARNNKLLASSARYIHPHFVLACARMGDRVPSAPFQTMVGVTGGGPLVFDSIGDIPIYYAGGGGGGVGAPSASAHKGSDQHSHIYSSMGKAANPSGRKRIWFDSDHPSDAASPATAKREVDDDNATRDDGRRKAAIVELSPDEAPNRSAPLRRHVGGNGGNSGASSPVLDLTSTQTQRL